MYLKTKDLAVGGASREEDVVHGDHRHVLLRARVAAVRQGLNRKIEN